MVSRGEPWWALLWRSRMVLIPVLVLGTFLSIIIPPFQSPDEFDHVKRAYLLTSGKFVLDSPKGRNPGGMIDTGLAEYMSVFERLPGHADRKLSADELAAARDIRWSGRKEFSQAPGTGFYFPVIYLPQAIGLAVGEHLDFSVDASYRLARFLSLSAVAALLFVAFSLYAVSPLVIGLLVIPMSAFQISSASLDGVSTAFAILAMAAFLRMSVDRENTKPWIFYALVLSVFLVATCRTHLYPLFLLLACGCLLIKKRKYYVLSFLSLAAALLWLYLASRNAAVYGSLTGASGSSIAAYYINNPLALFGVIFATLADADISRFYLESFLGNLGSLDAPFSRRTYADLNALIVLTALFSISVYRLRFDWRPRLILVITAIGSIALIFIALLLVWTPHPASVVKGVQGRYFLVPMIMFAYAISGDRQFADGIWRKIALALLLVLASVSIVNTTNLLLKRYYLSAEQPPANNLRLRPSVVLAKDRPIPLTVSVEHSRSVFTLKRIGIRLATYARTNTGNAELQLATADGQLRQLPFNLADLADNQYRFFDIEPVQYTSARIVDLTGGGISVWETHSDAGALASCVVLEYVDGSKRYTRGCPLP